MKKLLVSLPLTIVLITPLLHSAEPGKWTNLFNGKDLSGWSGFLVDSKVTRDQVWSVRDGILVCKGEPMGYLYTDQKYTSFDLVVEWRWAPGKTPGNSGVLLRINGEHTGLPRSIEAQLKSGDAGNVYGFRGMRVEGDPARSSHNPNHESLGDFWAIEKSGANEKSPGEWNRYEIRLSGTELTVKVNGKELNSARNCTIESGFIGLQSEGGEIHFRKVEIRPIQ